MLAIRDLHKTFGTFQALRGVTFDLGSAQRLAFLGPNGAGKTTLIRCLAGRTRPDQGTITLDGRPIDQPGVRDVLGLVPQEIAIYGELTTRQNLMAFGRFHGLRGSRLRSQVQWALQWTGLDGRAGDPVGSFSGGMKRRVNLACGVLHEPKVLLLDEPTVGVDPQSRQRIFAMLDDLRDRGTSILLTTHHLDEAQTHSDRIVIVDAGRIVADGTFKELVQKTIGTSRVVRLRVDGGHAFAATPPDDGVPAGRVTGDLSPVTGEAAGGASAAAIDSSPPRPGVRRSGVLTARIHDVGRELPGLIDAVRRQGYRVDDVEVQVPTLHHVFLHLTGHELRDGSS